MRRTQGNAVSFEDATIGSKGALSFTMKTARLFMYFIYFFYNDSLLARSYEGTSSIGYESAYTMRSSDADFDLI